MYRVSVLHRYLHNVSAPLNISESIAFKVITETVLMTIKILFTASAQRKGYEKQRTAHVFMISSTSPRAHRPLQTGDCLFNFSCNLLALAQSTKTHTIEHVSQAICFTSVSHRAKKSIKLVALGFARTCSFPLNRHSSHSFYYTLDWRKSRWKSINHGMNIANASPDCRI